MNQTICKSKGPISFHNATEGVLEGVAIMSARNMAMLDLAEHCVADQLERCLADLLAKMNHTFADKLGRPSPSDTIIAGHIAKAKETGLAEYRRLIAAEGTA